MTYVNWEDGFGREQRTPLITQFTLYGKTFYVVEYMGEPRMVPIDAVMWFDNDVKS